MPLRKKLLIVPPPSLKSWDRDFPCREKTGDFSKERTSAVTEHREASFKQLGMLYGSIIGHPPSMEEALGLIPSKVNNNDNKKNNNHNNNNNNREINWNSPEHCGEEQLGD